MKTNYFLSLILFSLIAIYIGILFQSTPFFSNKNIELKSNSSVSLKEHQNMVNFGILESSDKKEKNIEKVVNEFVTDFVIKKGLIFVNANLDGNVRQFLLDSGLGTNLILNSDAKYVDNLKDSDIYIDGVGGKSKYVETTFIDKFDWKGIKLLNSEVVALSLSHIDNTNASFAGVIGFNTFSMYELTFDYKNSILKVRNQKDLEREKNENGTLIATIPFELKKHMPVFTVQINGINYKMGLDTGAAINLMNITNLKNIKEAIYNLKDSQVIGYNGNTKVQKGVVTQTKTNDVIYNDMNYSFEETSIKALNKKYGFNIDGILGYEFLKKYLTVVDFLSKEIRIYDEKTN